MRILRISVTVLFIITLCVFVFVYVQTFGTDKSVPVISIPEGILDVSLNVDQAALLQDVTAYDDKDGDLTDKVLVESISRFTEPGVAVVYYAVCDNDNHVGSASRKIRYTDYVTPKFTMNGSLVFSTLENPQVLRILGAYDVIDGDISNKVIISAANYTPNTAGTFTVSAKAANSKGDVIYLQLPIYIEELSLSAPEILLHDYLLYLPVGSNYDVQSNLVSAADMSGTSLLDKVIIDTDLDLKTPGTYQVHYYASDAQGRRGHSVLSVIVEDSNP